jgi:uracil-DNA glycosylase
MNPRKFSHLKAMGVDVWQRRTDGVLGPIEAAPAESFGVSENLETPPRISEAPPSSNPALSVEQMDWPVLRDTVLSCTRCGLHSGRKQAVFGVGDQRAQWMVIGEAPGAEEDKQGEPFVGRAGMLLNAMLLAIGLKREQVYIANILKCRPPGNRDPRPEEVVCCQPYLTRQIQLIQPKIILAVGRIAAQNLLKTDTPIGRLRGRLWEYPGLGTPLVVTYHPAYLLRSPREKAKAWADLVFACKVFQEQSA